MCGNSSYLVVLNDGGNGQCEYTLGIGSQYSFGSCTNAANLFDGLTCKTYLGDLVMQIQNVENRTATYVAPDFQRWLTNIGLGSISTAGAHF